jgi:hypothetical protein
VRRPAAGDDRLDARAGPSAFSRGAEEKGGAPAQAIGLSGGGLSTKVIAVAVDEDGVMAVDVAEGQRKDAPLAAAAEATGGLDEVLGDKGFDSDAIRGAILDELDALPVIPNRANRTEPWPWDDERAERYGTGREPDRAGVRRGQAVPAVRHAVREARRDGPGRRPPAFRLHPRPTASPDRRHALAASLFPVCALA